jgi:hypothetical protein
LKWPKLKVLPISSQEFGKKTEKRFAFRLTFGHLIAKSFESHGKITEM